MRHFRPGAAACSALVLAALAAGCSRGPDGFGDAGSGTPSSSQAGASSGTEAAVLAAYQAYWDDLVAVSETPDPDDGRLARHAAKAQLTVVKRRMREMRQEGWALTGDVRPELRVVRVAEDWAVVHDCLESKDWYRVDSATGVTVPNPADSVAEYTVTLELLDGTWKVTASRESSGAPGCKS